MARPTCYRYNMWDIVPHAYRKLFSPAYADWYTCWELEPWSKVRWVWNPNGYTCMGIQCLETKSKMAMLEVLWSIDNRTRLVCGCGVSKVLAGKFPCCVASLRGASVVLITSSFKSTAIGVIKHWVFANAAFIHSLTEIPNWSKNSKWEFAAVYRAGG